MATATPPNAAREPERPKHPVWATSARRRLARWLWPSLALYASGLIAHAYQEVTAQYDVAGLSARMRPPYEIALGRVIDARPHPLMAELRRRYRPLAPSPAADPPGSEPHGWSEALGQLGIPAVAAHGPGSGLRPRLVFVDEQVWLVVTWFGRRPVLFDPTRGVILAHRGVVGSHVPALELLDAREAPW